jgi:hypothetical protein
MYRGAALNFAGLQQNSLGLTDVQRPSAFSRQSIRWFSLKNGGCCQQPWDFPVPGLLLLLVPPFPSRLRLPETSAVLPAFPKGLNIVRRGPQSRHPRPSPVLKCPGGGRDRCKGSPGLMAVKRFTSGGKAEKGPCTTLLVNPLELSE